MVSVSCPFFLSFLHVFIYLIKLIMTWLSCHSLSRYIKNRPLFQSFYFLFLDCSTHRPFHVIFTQTHLLLSSNNTPSFVSLNSPPYFAINSWHVSLLENYIIYHPLNSSYLFVLHILCVFSFLTVRKMCEVKTLVYTAPLYHCQQGK